MTIATQVNKVVAQGNGATTAFSYSFPLPAASNALVTVTDNLGNQTVLSPTQYSLSGVGSGNGGTLNYPLSGSPLASGWSICLQRLLPLQQLTQLVNQAGYFPAVVEAGMDALEMQIQQVASDVANSIQFPQTDPAGLNTTLPPATIRANMLQGYDSLGNVVAVPSVSGTAVALALSLISSIGGTLVTWIQLGVSAIARTIADRFRDTVHVQDFMSSTQVNDIRANTLGQDVTAAIQAAHDSLSASGGCIKLPFGSYLISGPINVNKPVTISGDGYSSVISTTSATANHFNVTSPNVWIKKLRLVSSVTQTAGWRIQFSNACSRVRVSKVRIDGFLQGIQSSAVATCVIQDTELLNGIASTGVGIRFDGGADNNVIGVLMDAAAQIFAGIMITACADTKIHDCNIIHGGQSLYLNPGVGQVVTSVWATSSFFDTSGRGLYAFANGGTIMRCTFDQCWFSSAANQGALMQTAAGGSIDGMYFNLCQLFLNGADGLNVNDTGVVNVHVRGGSAAQNAGSGYAFNANVSNFSVMGVRSGAGDGLTGNVNGIFVGTGTGGNYTICDNILRSNTTSPLVDGGTGTGKVIQNNVDYDNGRKVAYTPGAITAGSITTTTLTVFGAFMGDIVQLSFSNDLQKVNLYGNVSAAGTVTANFHNPTGSTVTLASGNVYATIKRIS